MTHKKILERANGLPKVLAACLISIGFAGCGDDSANTPEGQDTEGTAGTAGEAGGEEGGEAGDSEDSDDTGEPNGCVSNEEFFENEIQPILESDCRSCHNPAGQAAATSYKLQSNTTPGYLEANLAIFTTMSKLRFEGEPWILLKPTGRMEHGGALRFTEDSPQANAFMEMIELLDDPVVCEDDGDLINDFFAGVHVHDAPGTLRKASILLAGRVPTDDEIAAAEEGGMDSIDELLAPMLREEGFYDRIREAYNDRFLTRRYHSINGSDSAAINLLDRRDYPEADVFANMNDEGTEDYQRYANDAIAEEPTRLLEYILRNDLPYSELLTADYTVANPFSAQVYGVTADFEDETDPNEFLPVKLPGIPHAGVATMVTYLTRYTTTRTNRNRARSRRFQEFFLATDVISLGTRPTDASGSEYDNPTLNDANCVSCHAEVDPAAATFANFDDMGRYRPQGHALRGDNDDDPDLLDVPENGWYADMRPAGFKGFSMPGEWEHASLQWLAYTTVDDPLFSLSAVYLVYEGLFGRKPLVQPSDPAMPNFTEAVLAAKVQREVFRGIADKFVESEYDFRVVVTELVKSQYFRAHNSDELNDSRRAELSDVGIARMLTPEELNRKITATTGVTWGPLENPNLLSRNEFLILYGGIDSDNVNERAYDASGSSANIAKRMSMEVACNAVAQDFAKPNQDKLLFPNVSADSVSASDIRANIRYLHWHLLGEKLAADDPTIDATYDLWNAVYQEGQRGIAAEEYSASLPGMCQAVNAYGTDEPLDSPITEDPAYTIRAWTAVTAYLLTDYKFLHD